MPASLLPPHGEGLICPWKLLIQVALVSVFYQRHRKGTDRRTACGSQLSPASLSVLELELGWLGLATSAFICCISPQSCVLSIKPIMRRLMSVHGELTGGWVEKYVRNLQRKIKQSN